MAPDKKEQIIEKAARLFMERGYENTTVRELAKAVKIQGPAIYHHFKSKKEILNEINDISWRKFQEEVVDEIRKADDPEERIRIYIRNMIRYQLSLGIMSFVVEDFISTRYVKKRKARDREVFELLRGALQELKETRKGTMTGDPTIASFILYNIQ